MENLPKPPGLPADAADAKVALLIDADNVSDKHADALMKKAAFYGNVIVRRAYGVMKNFPWKKEVLHRYAITPIARPAYVPGKNITDITLVIDAMDLAHRKIINVVCIASNDSDFSPLAMKLRENEILVYGFGDKRAPDSFKASCNAFNYLSIDSEKSDTDAEKHIPEESDVPPKKTTTKEDLIKNLMDACTEYGDNDGWMFMAAAGLYLKRIDPEFSPQNYGFEKFKKLIESMDEFEIDENLNTTGHPPNPKIRIKETPKKKK